MSRAIVGAGLVAWSGATLVLSEIRWFSRTPLADRLRPYLAGGWQQAAKGGSMSVDSLREVIAPLASAIGERIAHALGVRDDIATRLNRVHSDLDPTVARVRQVAWSVGGFALAALASVSLSLPTAAGLLVVLGIPAATFLVIEQRVSAASAAWQRRLFHELPVVGEQIGMLLSAGYSVGAAIDRIAERGAGACAQDLARVGRRVRQGLSQGDALREWAELADVAAVHRLVAILALSRDTGDLGRLISDEARTLRREARRELATTIERREQQVWIPVTVATLVPGTVFLAVPFLQAMRLFAGG